MNAKFRHLEYIQETKDKKIFKKTVFKKNFQNTKIKYFENYYKKNDEKFLTKPILSICNEILVKTK